MAGSGKKLDRARRDARRMARDARRLAARHARRLGDARAIVDAAAEEVEAAAESGEPSRLSEALRALDGLWETHLLRRGRPLWRELGEAAIAAVIVALVVRAFVVDSFLISTGSMTPTLLVGDRIFVSKLAYAVRFPFTHLRLVDLAAPRRGDVIVFENPREPDKDYVKRVVGVPGDVIELREQVLVVNGVPQPRSPLGELSYAGRHAGAGKAFSETCRRYRESLAKGELAPPAALLPSAVEASWQAAAAGGVAVYEVLQCRRARLDAREGPFEVVKPGHLFVLGDNRDDSADSRGEGGWQVPLDHVKGRATFVYFSRGAGGAEPTAAAGVRLDRLFKRIE